MFYYWIIPIQRTIGKIAENILTRDCHSGKPFKKITTDITHFNVCNKRCIFRLLMDLFNREIFHIPFLNGLT